MYFPSVITKEMWTFICLLALKKIFLKIYSSEFDLRSSVDTYKDENNQDVFLYKHQLLPSFFFNACRVSQNRT